MDCKTEEDIMKLIKEDVWMMDILKTAKMLHLPDWWICAGFVRSKIWDNLHGFEERTRLEDIDVIYFDPTNLDESVEKKYEEILKDLRMDMPWSVKNEARMHLKNNIQPYQSCVDAISKFPETATALGVKLNEMDEIILTAPCGIDDAINGIIKPSPQFLNSRGAIEIFEARLLQKNWKQKWHMLQIEEIYQK
ncbi:nucleotidyltransferase family protein [Bacillus sp. OAE603]|uniref:nucleotidyltransferase family protein n=1 Tax=Gottfriedia sp. OAE603 TaxID=2663872 RepID=UPI00178BD770